jgi:hypothetical protein
MSTRVRAGTRSRRAYHPHGGDEAAKLCDRTSNAIALDERACPAVPCIERILIGV